MRSNRFFAAVSKRLSSILHTDFCPGANVYVYWLKEPVGWFVVALLSSCLVGAFFSPVGWSIAAGLAVVLLLGLGFPALATRALSCHLRCESEVLYEGEETCLLLRVTNPLPIPVVGLVIEKYFQIALQSSSPDSLQAVGDSALARVPAFSSAEYRLPILPQYRGLYPNSSPQLACSFPFGIYTSRRPITAVDSVLVRPLLIPLKTEFDFSGDRIAYVGEGNRPSHHGDFLGVREFQQGDSLRSIHWAQSAKLDELVVCERGGPQKSPFAIHLSTQRGPGTDLEVRDNLAWRVRIAATVADLLASRNVPFQLQIDDVSAAVATGKSTAASALEQLAMVPLDPEQGSSNTDIAWATQDQLQAVTNGIAIGVVESTPQSSTEDNATHLIHISVKLGVATYGGDLLESNQLDLREGIDLQLEQILREANREHAA